MCKTSRQNVKHLVNLTWYGILENAPVFTIEDWSKNPSPGTRLNGSWPFRMCDAPKHRACLLVLCGRVELLTMHHIGWAARLSYCVTSPQLQISRQARQRMHNSRPGLPVKVHIATHHLNISTQRLLEFNTDEWTSIPFSSINSAIDSLFVRLWPFIV